MSAALAPSRTSVKLGEIDPTKASFRALVRLELDEWPEFHVPETGDFFSLDPSFAEVLTRRGIATVHDVTMLGVAFLVNGHAVSVGAEELPAEGGAEPRVRLFEEVTVYLRRLPAEAQRRADPSQAFG